MYAFVALDPRKGETSQEANDRVFSFGPVYGVEVTVPALAERCIANLGPQHTGSNVNCAAIEEALKVALPPEGAIIATIRANLDSVGSMAVFNLRMKGESLTSALGRVKRVADLDKFAHREWTPRPLPTTEEPWPEKSDLAAIDVAVANFRISMTRRVAWMEQWLLKGEDPVGYRSQVETERKVLVSALENGQIVYSMHSDDHIAVVESIHNAVITVGYALAPVVVARNPSFQKSSMEAPYVKFTICQYAGGFVDLKSVLAELNEMEPGWGGSLLIGWSPQGISSKLTTDQVVEVVDRHLLRFFR